MQLLLAQIPLKLVSPNIKTHWTKLHKTNKLLRSRLQFDFLLVQDLTSCHEKLNEGLCVRLKRRGKREMDYDNLVYCFKPVRDTIADLLIPGLAKGLADGDKRLEWKYEQEVGKDYLVEIEISTQNNSM